MNERKILSAVVNNRNIWESVKDQLVPADYDSITNHLFKLVGDYYATDKAAADVDVEILADRFARSEPSEKLTGLVKNILADLPEVSGNNVSRELREVKTYNLGLKLAAHFSAGTSGPEVRSLLHNYLELTEGSTAVSDDEEPVDFDVKGLVSRSFQTDGLIRIYPKILTDHLDGGARPGHHILVFAPTEMGKTLVVINMVAGFTIQGLRTLYVGNEDPVADLQMRYISRLTNMQKRDILAYPDKAQALLDKRNYKNVIFAPLAPGTFPKIRSLVAKFSPQVVVLDQLRNIDVHSENRTQALERAATEARNLAKSMGVLVLSVTQAADSASGKRVLNRGDVDGSNVGIPGQCDVMLGIGADDELESRNMRIFSFPKNKISGNHTTLEVVIDPTLSKVIEAANDERFTDSRAGSGTASASHEGRAQAA